MDADVDAARRIYRAHRVTFIFGRFAGLGQRVRIKQRGRSVLAGGWTLRSAGGGRLMITTMTTTTGSGKQRRAVLGIC